MDKGTVRGRGGDRRPSDGARGGRRKWVRGHKVFEGSVKEGQGFAFKRKQKVQYEYNKLLTKERRRKAASTSQYREEFPEHLRHLYVAEAQKLKKEDLVNRSKRSICRMAQQVTKKAEGTEVNDDDDDDDDDDGDDDEDDDDDDDDDDDGDDATSQKTGPQPEAAAATITEQVETATVDPEPKNAIEAESIPMSNRLKKKIMRKTSYQTAQEQFENARDERLKKNEEFLRKKKEKDDGIQQYKQKKKEAFQILSKKTKKGQPNLNLQMEYLLQKIQGSRK